MLHIQKYLSDKIIWEFFKIVAEPVLPDFTKMLGKNGWEIHKDPTCCLEQIMDAAIYNTEAVQLLLPF